MSFVDVKTGKNSGQDPHEATLKTRQLGTHAIGAFAGAVNAGNAVLDKLDRFFQRVPRPEPGSATNGRILQLMHQALAGAHRTASKRKWRDVSPTQILVANVNSLGNYQLRVFNSKGVEIAGEGSERGPFLFGSGIWKSVGDAHEKDVGRFTAELEANYAKSRTTLLSNPERLASFTHLLAVSFTNTFVSENVDSHTGGGVQILSLERQDGVKEYHLWEYDLPAGAEVDTGRWNQRTHHLLTNDYPLGQATTGRVSESGGIESLFVDQSEQLSVLTEARNGRVEIGPATRWNQLPIATRKAIMEIHKREPQ